MILWSLYAHVDRWWLHEEGGGGSVAANSNKCEKDMKCFHESILLYNLALHTKEQWPLRWFFESYIVACVDVRRGRGGGAAEANSNTWKKDMKRFRCSIPHHNLDVYTKGKEPLRWFFVGFSSTCHRVRWRWWLQFQLQQLLKRYQALALKHSISQFSSMHKRTVSSEMILWSFPGHLAMDRGGGGRSHPLTLWKDIKPFHIIGIHIASEL